MKTPEEKPKKLSTDECLKQMNKAYNQALEDAKALKSKLFFLNEFDKELDKLKK